MAQAARLNLRMQKEIKLLLNDPPPGVSLELPENENLSTSLSSIKARIEGSEGTVYAKGVFVLKIQIPERYPFQPPIVTFVTPIYHPNIDNGGRICLDILNLPPKGAWQPSLNISTVLTSIGLLLSDPNPDDGLMAEISREYKYNRQLFDQNARSWTEKYANPAAIGSTAWCSIKASVPAPKQQMEVNSLEALPKVSNRECEGTQKKMRLLGQKLSLKSDSPKERNTTEKQNNMPSQFLPTSKSTDAVMAFSHEKVLDVEVNLGQQTPGAMDVIIVSDGRKNSSDQYEGNHSKLLVQKLSLGSETCSKEGNRNEENVIPNQFVPSASNPKDSTMGFPDIVLERSITKRTGDLSGGLNKEHDGAKNKLQLLSRKLTLKSDMPENGISDEKQNILPNQLLSSTVSFNDLLQGSSDVSFGKSSNKNSSMFCQNPTLKEMVSVSENKEISSKECDGSRKKLRLLNQKLSLKPELPENDTAGDKENPTHIRPKKSATSNQITSDPQNHTMCFLDVGLKKALKQDTCPIKQNSHAGDTLIVSDSEESGDECDMPSRLRSSYMKRRLAEKWKS